MEKAKQVTWRLLAAGVCLLTVSSVARADSLDEQRSRYAQIKQAWDNRQMDVVEQMMPGLKDYPLYPYLEYRQITDDLMNQPAVTVTNFVRANPTLPPARTLQSRFVNGGQLVKIGIRIGVQRIHFIQAFQGVNHF